MPRDTEMEFDKNLPVGREWAIFLFLLQEDNCSSEIKLRAFKLFEFSWIPVSTGIIIYFLYLTSTWQQCVKSSQHKLHIMRRGTMMTTKSERGLKGDAGTAGVTMQHLTDL